MEGMLKGITPVISIIVLVLIVVSISGAFWTFLSGYWQSTTSKQIEVVDSFCIGTNQAKVLIKNIGNSDVVDGDIRVMDSTSGVDLTGVVRWSTFEPRAGLVLKIDFEDGGGNTATDDSGYGNDGTLLPVGGEPTWVTGKNGGGLEFDGATGYVDAGTDASLDMTDAITVSAWAMNVGNCTNCYNANGRWDNIVTKWDCTPVCAVSSWWLGIPPAAYPYGSMRMIFVNSSGQTGSKAIIGNKIVKNDSLWHHVAFTYDGGYMKIYIDGRLEKTKPYSEGIHVNSSIPVMIGSSGHTLPGGFNGTIDEVRIYNRALYMDEINALMDIKDKLSPGETMTMVHNCTGMCNFRIVMGGHTRMATVQC